MTVSNNQPGNLKFKILQKSRNVLFYRRKSMPFVEKYTLNGYSEYFRIIYSIFRGKS